MKVFLSHNKADKRAAREFAAVLALEGIDVWFDEWTISAGDSIVGSIEQGLRQSSHLLLLWSKHAKRSKWVTAELRAALVRSLSKGKIRIIPICLDGTPLPPLLRDLKYIRKKRSADATRRELVLAVTGQAPKDAYLRALVKRYHSALWSRGSRDSLGVKACPSCGSARLKRWKSPPDGITPGHWLHVGCEDCSWSALKPEWLPNNSLQWP
jgi:hypothetical protein